jgi:hypothetical protein
LDLAAFLIASSLIVVPRKCNFPQPIGCQHPARTRQGEMVFRHRTNQSLPFSLIQVGVVFFPRQKIVYRALSSWL